MDPTSLVERLALAEGHVAEGAARIRRQREIHSELTLDGPWKRQLTLAPCSPNSKTRKQRLLPIATASSKSLSRTRAEKF